VRNGSYPSKVTAWQNSLLAKLGVVLSVSVLVRRLAATQLPLLLGRTDLPHSSELAALPPAHKALLAGFASWIVLILIVTTIAVVSVEMSRIGLSVWFNPPTSGEPGREHRVTSNFDNILLRPLFSRSRQIVDAVPIQVAAPSPPAPLVDSEITLKGVFMNGSSASAFLLSPGTPLGTWVRTDEEFSGWKVVAVWPDQVQLKGESETRTVLLSYGHKK